MSTNEFIAYRVAELCQERRMSKYRLAQITGITQSALHDIIEMESIPTVPTLEKICDAFRITLAQFFTKEGCPDLTEAQKELLETWNTLDTKEQEILLTFLRSLKK